MSTYAVKVQGGFAKVIDVKTGGLKRTFGSSVVSAQILGDLVQVTEKSGRAKVVDIKTGGVKRTL